LTLLTAGLALTSSQAAPGDYGAQLQPQGLALTSDAALADMDRRLSTIDVEIARDKKELETIAPLHTAAETRIRARGRRLYRLIRAGLMPLSGGFAAFVEHAQKVEGLKRALGADLATEQKLESRGAQLATLLDALARERTELSDRKGLAEAAKIAIDEERRRREAFERAFASSMGPKLLPGPYGSGDEIVVYGPSGKMPLESVDPASFKARKGRLTFPVSGQAEVKAMQKDGGPGVEITAPLGAVVRAVHPGRVAFADRYGAYGQLVILDHGERCYTVSANLGAIDVKVGDEVSAGERLGTVGDDGRGPSLYFEIRIGNDKVPPQTWLGL
ncbi:MAG: peptidoglycan DD-metalloendopeptidase family protein, partial [Polyangiales bacterium]